MTNWTLTHPDDGTVYACPACDRAGQLRELESGEVSCYECSHTAADRSALTVRSNERGSNLTDEDRQRFTAGSPERYEMTSEQAREIGKKGGRPPEAFGDD